MREHKTWIALIAVFLAALLLVNVLPYMQDKPYSSYSTEPDGTKAAYLLLEELGFQVERKTSRNWNGEGVVLALGSGYLRDPGDVLVLEGDLRFTNGQIESHAVELVELLWPYYSAPIVFEEYGRSHTPVFRVSDASDKEVTFFGIMPFWLKLLLANGALCAFFIMFFYKQRLGKPIPAEGFEGRHPLEGIHAMAAAMAKAGVYRDCLQYYYQYQTRTNRHWDGEDRLAQAVQQVQSEQDALLTADQIDKAIKEYRHEGKRSSNNAVK